MVNRGWAPSGVTTLQLIGINVDGAPTVFWKVWGIENLESLWTAPIVWFYFSPNPDNAEIWDAKISRYVIGRQPSEVIGIIAAPFDSFAGFAKILKIEVGTLKWENATLVELFAREWDNWYKIDVTLSDGRTYWLLEAEIKTPPPKPQQENFYGSMYVPPNIVAENLRFGVLKEWLNEFKIPENAVRLLKYQYGHWYPQSTRPSGESDENYVYFSAEVDNFSTFAIVAGMLGAEEPTVIHEPPMDLIFPTIATAVIAIAFATICWFKFRK
jgi:hypothetical protein